MSDSDKKLPALELLVQVIEKGFEKGTKREAKVAIGVLFEAIVPEEKQENFVERLLVPWQDDFTGHLSCWPYWVNDPEDDEALALRTLIEELGGVPPEYEPDAEERLPLLI